MERDVAAPGVFERAEEVAADRRALGAREPFLFPDLGEQRIRREVAGEGVADVLGEFLEPAVLQDGDRAFLTYSTTGRGNERVNGSLGLLDMTPYGRGEAWEDNPEGRPEGGSPCWSWRSDADGNATWGPTSRPVPQWTRPGATPVETLGRHGHHH